MSDRDQEICRKYQDEKVPPADLSKTYNLSRSRIFAILSKAGIQRNQRVRGKNVVVQGITPDQEPAWSDLIAKMRSDFRGRLVSVSELKRRTGYPVTLLKKWLLGTLPYVSQVSNPLALEEYKGIAGSFRGTGKKKKLSNEVVKDARVKIDSKEWSQSHAAQVLGVSKTVVNMFVAGRIYMDAGGPTKSPHRLSDEAKADIRRKRLEGIPVSVLLADHKVSRGTIYKVLKEKAETPTVSP